MAMAALLVKPKHSTTVGQLAGGTAEENRTGTSLLAQGFAVAGRALVGEPDPVPPQSVSFGCSIASASSGDC